MPADHLYRIAKNDIPRAAERLKDAFKEDPLWAEVFKNDPHRDQSLTSFFTCPLLYGLKFGKVYATSSRLEAIAAWLPGKYSNMSTWGMLRCGALSYGIKMGKETIGNLSIMSKQLNPDKKKQMKGKPYLYLLIIGVASSSQGKGLGSQLMDALKKECDSRGLYLYLETEKEENLPFYKKHGLTVARKIIFEKFNLPMWEMVRKPQ